MTPTGTDRFLVSMIALLALAANIAGYGLDLYARYWWFDRVLHAGTIFAVTLWLGVNLFAAGLRPPTPILSFILLASVGMALGSLWEVVEWQFNKMMPADVIKGKDDMVKDIIMDIAGSLFAAGVAMALLAPRRDGGA